MVYPLVILDLGRADERNAIDIVYPGCGLLRLVSELLPPIGVKYVACPDDVKALSLRGPGNTLECRGPARPHREPTMYVEVAVEDHGSMDAAKL